MTDKDKNYVMMYDLCKNAYVSKNIG